MIKKVTCFGAGYVGGPTMAMMALKCPDISFIVYDLNQIQIDKWNSQQLPCYEEGLQQIIQQTIGKNLHFTTDIQYALEDCDIAFIAVNTPSKSYGFGSDCSLDISYIDSCIRTIQKYQLTQNLIIVEKSTVPAKTSDYIRAILKSKNTEFKIDIVSNPEFLAEGTAMRDLEFPDRVILGGEEDPCKIVASIYKRWVSEDKIVFTSIYSAELSKIVANSFLAQRISSINSISQICEKLNANVNEVAKCIGLDSRIGSKYLQVSIGFGGSCLKKDLLSLIYLCESLQLDEVANYWRQVYQMNEFQKNRFANLILNSMFNSLNNKVIVVLGLSFKTKTNDTRESAALTIIKRLQEEQAILRIYDPQAKLPLQYDNERTKQFLDLDTQFVGANAIVILTEWEEFTQLAYKQYFNQMEQPAYLFDGRNLLDAKIMRSIGYLYYCLGQQ